MKQVTCAPHGHILTHTGVWSPDGQWIVYDVRSDPAGSVFDGTRIEKVHALTGEVRILYQSTNGAHCAVASYSPREDKVAFILGPEYPTPDWQYAPEHRRGVVVDAGNPGVAHGLDPRNPLAPFTPGALRGGTHLHTFSGDGRWLAFTYHDHLLARLDPADPSHDLDQRNIGIGAPGAPVQVMPSHPRNNNGEYFCALVTRTINHPQPGSDEIQRAAEEAWVGNDGYLRADGTRQKRAIAFQGQVLTDTGRPMLEAFIVDIPEDPTLPGDGPLEGTQTRRPMPPRGTLQRRLTYTQDRRYAGLCSPRHWLCSSPDGSRIACLMRDDAGIGQLWSVSPNGGPPVQITHDRWAIASAFSWSPDGRRIAYVADDSVFMVDVHTGISRRFTTRCDDADAPQPQACVFSPDGQAVAFVRPVAHAAAHYNQIFVASAVD